MKNPFTSLMQLFRQTKRRMFDVYQPERTQSLQKRKGPLPGRPRF